MLNFPLAASVEPLFLPPATDSVTAVTHTVSGTAPLRSMKLMLAFLFVTKMMADNRDKKKLRKL